MLVVVGKVVATLLSVVAAVLTVVWKKSRKEALVVGIVVAKLEAVDFITSGSCLGVPSAAFALWRRKLSGIYISMYCFIFARYGTSLAICGHMQ